MKRFTRQALGMMRATGITSVQDAAVDDGMMQIYKRLYDTHRLNMRVRGATISRTCASRRRADRPRVKFRANGPSIPITCAPMR